MSTGQRLSSMAGLLWHSLSPDEVVARLGTDPLGGLTPAEAQRRLVQHGRNELQEQPRAGFLRRLLEQFKNMVVLLLIGASAVSALLGEWYEAGAIILIVSLNAVLGVVQEGRAEQALAALKKMSAPEARVFRGGRFVQVPEAEVVPGDVVLLEAGNYIPADMRLLESANLQIDEASFTGESVPVSKNADSHVAEDAPLGDRRTIAYKGTLVVYGRGRGLAVATGMATEIGQIARLIESIQEEETPLQRRLDELGRWLAYGALAICGLVFLVIFARAASAIAHEHGIAPGAILRMLGNPAIAAPVRQAGLDAFLTAVALAIAAVPEGLPAIVTINLALGMREMVTRHALIRRLPAVETLGSASVIACDKTGTLTQNEMTATRLYVPDLVVEVTGRGYTPSGSFHKNGVRAEPQDVPGLLRLLRGALLCSDARLEVEPRPGEHSYRIVGDPTEGALVVAAAKANLQREDVEALYPRRDEIPFDATRKRMSTLHHDPQNGDAILFVKGAPDLILDLCSHSYRGDEVEPLRTDTRAHIASVNRDMARQALRVLAVAERRFEEPPDTLDAGRHETNLVFIGLIGMIDPARPEVAPAIERARRAGIKTVMVTGDYPDTARAIAAEIGLASENGRVVSGTELDQWGDDELAEAVDEVAVFARVSPSHKLRIVDTFRRRDDVIAMTGDGVNDAPALKRASIGVAMGITGTDVSKETADMVLMDDNYASIVNAVEQGRIIYDNIRKFVYFLLSCNLAEIMVIGLATLAGHPSPLSAIQLLWLNLLTDGAPALALGVEKGDPDVMQRPPRAPDEPIIDRVMQMGIIVQTVFITGVTLVGFFSGFRRGGLVEGRSVAFVVLSFSELLRAYTTRSERFSIFQLGPFSNRYMQYAVLASIVLLLAVIYIPFLNPIFDTLPLAWLDWAEIVPLMLVPSVAAEITKFVLRRSTLALQPVRKTGG